MLKYTKEQVVKMYHELTVKEWAEKLGITMHKANQLTKQLGLKKKPGPKVVPFEFLED